MPRLSPDSLATLFTDARSHNGWLDVSVSDEQIADLYDLVRWGPTANNGCPARFVFIRTEEGKRRLRPALAESNVQKAMLAPVVVIVATDTRFEDELPKLFHAYDARAMLQGLPEGARAGIGLLNAGLQGGYLIMAARALGLDCGPIGGFDKAAVDAAFLPDGRWKSLFLCSLGHGDPQKLRPRGPRLAWNDACRFA